jgi:hypothetical protein
MLKTVPTENVVLTTLKKAILLASYGIPLKLSMVLRKYKLNSLARFSVSAYSQSHTRLMYLKPTLGALVVLYFS